MRASHSISPPVFLAEPVEVGAAHETLPEAGRCVWDASERRARCILRVTSNWIARHQPPHTCGEKGRRFRKGVDFFLRRFGCQDGRRSSFDRPTGRVGSNLHL